MSSERLKNTNQVSNDQIIDDITKELQSSLSTTENPAEFVISPGTSTEDKPKESGDAAPFSDIPLSDPELDKEDDEQSDTESINEESLKDVEVDLTDDQKEERRIIAEQLKEAGNSAFKVADYQLSIEKYTSGLQTCPLQFAGLRAVLYCNRSAARMKLAAYDKAVKDCTKAIELDDKYLKAYIRRAQSYEASEKYEESLADYKRVLELEPAHAAASAACARLPPLVERRNEQLKQEMLGKLKDLGNMILKPFGLSTSNFQMEQDPESKGYKINFKQ